jgi:TIGR02687 family protein
MQINELALGLLAKFKQSRIVFWYDAEQSFTEELEQLTNSDAEGFPKDICILNMKHESTLQVKKRIELEEPQSKFLLYYPAAEPEPERDWMLDIRLYSEQFFADHSSMILNELGIQRMSLRPHISQRSAFFASKQRISALKRLVEEQEDEHSLDRKMMAVITKADSANISEIVLSLLREYANSIETNNTELPLFNQLVKFDLEAVLWANLSVAFGYNSDAPSLSDFVLKLFCTDFWSQTEGANREWVANNLFTSVSGKATSLAFMSTWRDSRSYSPYFTLLSTQLNKQLEVEKHISNAKPEQLIECHTFEAIEQTIIRGLINQLLDSSTVVDRVAFAKLISSRLDGYWCLAQQGYRSIYSALKAAEELLFLRSRYMDGFHFDNAKALYHAYTTELFRFDQQYRVFNEHVLPVVSKGSDILRRLDDEIENLYSNWYLFELGTAWDKHIQNENLIEQWRIEGIEKQSDFYTREVYTRLLNKSTKRAFVIISDALRYEVAEELYTMINGEKRFKAEISSQLGVIPSYTQLGMAALLPHKTIHYSDNNTTVFVDDLPSQGVDNRNSILQNQRGIAVTAKELIGWSNAEGREKIKDAEVVYIYHDVIDSIGDKAPTEDKTFEACRNALEELKDLVTRVINRLNASRVVITADHGFLFQQKMLSSSDKTSLQVKPANAIEAKKRYIVGTNLSNDDACWKGSIKNTANGKCETEFLLPKGIQRFHFVGGAKFVHGGAMLQEICVPVLTVKELQKEQAAKHQKSPVPVVVANQSIKLVNNIDKVKFIQTEPVGEKFTARQLNIFIINADKQLVSSQETITFDSDSPDLSNRTREATLKLIGSQFDRNAKYTLILQNSDTSTEYSRYNVTIDLAFQDDFF